VGGKKEAKLRLYVGGTVEAKLDTALTHKQYWARVGKVELRLDLPLNVEMELRLHLAS